MINTKTSTINSMYNTTAINRQQTGVLTRASSGYDRKSSGSGSSCVSSDPNTPPSPGHNVTPTESISQNHASFEFESLKQQVLRLQKEISRYQQKEAHERSSHNSSGSAFTAVYDSDQSNVPNDGSAATTSVRSTSIVRPTSDRISQWSKSLEPISSKNSTELRDWDSTARFSAITGTGNHDTSDDGLNFLGSAVCNFQNQVNRNVITDSALDIIGSDNLTTNNSTSNSFGSWSNVSASGYYRVHGNQESRPSTHPLMVESYGYGQQTLQNRSGYPLNQVLNSTTHSSNGNTLGAAVSAYNYQPPTPWNKGVHTGLGHENVYFAHTEPLDYRRLLEKDAYCNWDYVVDKIVSSNDQQASIFLQQKLKLGTPSQKQEIVEAILKQCYALMVNRFGNFLVQRCFEHGTPQQVIKIAQTIRGNTITLSMDPFGCHVVQKAFDSVPEEYKACFVHELLRRIPDTVIHRYACHVWQKLFELHWSDSPPQIMKYVNEALRGMWHEVALGETGSLVVQNIFENCVEEDKRPCINEVLNNIDVIARGQFGNWCIQHICENGATPDRSRAVDHILHYATEYSIDQYASKVIEKCLKVGGNDFLDRYLTRVCEGRPDRPRMPLIDIAGDQFGNYLIQYILANATPQHREMVATHVRKHMVSLRGSKYGSRVAMLCCNPVTATRPGPATSGYSGRFHYGKNGFTRQSHTHYA